MRKKEGDQHSRVITYGGTVFLTRSSKIHTFCTSCQKSKKMWQQQLLRWKRDGVFNLNCRGDHIGASWREVLLENIDEWRSNSLIQFQAEMQCWARDSLGLHAAPTSQVAADPLDASMCDAAADVNGGTSQLAAGPDPLDGSTQPLANWPPQQGQTVLRKDLKCRIVSLDRSVKPVAYIVREIESGKEISSELSRLAPMITPDAAGEDILVDQLETGRTTEHAIRSRTCRHEAVTLLESHMCLGRFQELGKIPVRDATYPDFEAGNETEWIKKMSYNYTCPVIVNLHGPLGSIGNMGKCLARGPWGHEHPIPGQYDLSLHTSAEHDSHQRKFVECIDPLIGVEMFDLDQEITKNLNTRPIDFQCYVPVKRITIAGCVPHSHAYWVVTWHVHYCTECGTCLTRPHPSIHLTTTPPHPFPPPTLGCQSSKSARFTCID